MAGANARTTARIVLVAAAVFTGLGGVVIAAETLDTPGGIGGAALIACWVIPIAVLSVLAWRWAATATRILAVLTAVVIAGSVAFAIAPGAWRAMENGAGPVRALGTFILVLPLAVLGLRAPRPAGIMLVTIGAGPLMAVVLGRPMGMASLAAVCLPAAVLGLIESAGAR